MADASAIPALVEQNYTFVPRYLEILIDNDETGLGAVSDTCISALYQKASPILVTNHLIYSIFSEKVRTPEKEDILSGLQFKSEEWIIKKIDTSLTLFLPIIYLRSIGIHGKGIDELSLGLRVNHLPNTTLEKIIQHQPEKLSADSFIPLLDKIFCSRSDYTNKNAPALPKWSFYMFGHGLKGESIVGLKLDEFKKVLDFFENNLNTQVLAYSSCYGAGTNSEIIYNDTISTVQKIFSFPIITQALTDATVASGAPDLKFDEKNNPYLRVITNLKAFFEQISQAYEIKQFQDAINNIFPVIPEGIYAYRWDNAAQIRLPGLHWFTPVASNKDIASLGSILTKNRNIHKPLSLATYFKSEPKALLLNTIDIPFELILDSTKLEAIISMISGDAVHKIKKITSLQNSIDTILGWFMHIKMLDARKLFFIEEIDAADYVIAKNVIIYNNKIPAFFTIPDKFELYAFYSENGKIYFKKTGQEGSREADNNQKKDYLKLLIEVTGEVEDTVSINSLNNNNLPLITAPVLFHKIEGSTSLETIFRAITQNLNKNAFVWAKEITGFYQGYEKKNIFLPHLKYNARITLKDVIIDASKDSLFFTYDGKFYSKATEIKDDYKHEYAGRLPKAF